MKKKKFIILNNSKPVSDLAVDFSSAPDGTLPILSGTTWSISSGVAINTPTEGTELVVNGNMEAGDPPTGWLKTGTGTVISQQADERTGGAGSKSLQLEIGSTTYGSAYRLILSNYGAKWIKTSFYFKSLADNAYYIAYQGGLFGTGTAPVSLTWSATKRTGIFLGASGYIKYSTAGSAGAQIRFDDVSQVELAGVYAGTTLNKELIVAKINSSITNLYENQGLFICGNHANIPTSFVMAIMQIYATGFVNLFLVKSVNSAVTSLISTNTVYVAGKYLEIRRSATNTFQLFYNDVQIGTDQTIADTEIISNKNVGICSDGGSGNSISAFFAGSYRKRNIVYLGTSITEGTNTYVPLVNTWLNSQTPIYSFNFRTNLGAGGSSSWYALARMETIKTYDVTLIMLEYGVNDQYSDTYAKIQEALIRRIRTLLPTTKIVFLAFTQVADKDVDDATNLNQQLHDRWKTLCAYYGISFVSFADVLKALVDGGATLADYLSDTVHPTAAGHVLGAETVRSTVLTSLASANSAGMPARLFDSAGFEAVPVWRTGVDNDAETGAGWSTVGTSRKCSTANATISWVGTFISFGFIPTAILTGGSVAISIDGGAETTINISSIGDVYFNHTGYSLAEHTVVIRIVSGEVGFDTFISI